ncbi:MAG: zf-TFIIB domain-containing protein [Gemmatimonadales bacterium]
MTDRPSQNEEEYFLRREAELVKARRAMTERERAEAERLSHYMKCPKCGADLVVEHHHGLEVDRCHECQGVWFDASEAGALLKESSGIADMFKSILRGVSGA